MSSTSSLIRLNKLMAHQGWGSRREVDQLIEKGWVTINGQKAKKGQRVTEDVEYEVRQFGRKVMVDDNKVTVLFHKPLGVLSCTTGGYSRKKTATSTTQSFPLQQETTAIHYLTAKNAAFEWKRGWQVEPRGLPKMAVAGRLDVNSTGLLVFTQDGVIARQIIAPDSNLEKEYLVRLRPDPKRPSLQDVHVSEVQSILRRLREGITDEGELLDAKSINVVNKDQLQIVLTSGKKHHIRRMMDAVGLDIQALKRVRIGNIRLGGLKPGQWRFLGSNETVA
jgi:23S rRNA pseudouridine2604 synthase